MGDGTKLIFTGSEVPSNQLASLSALPDFCFIDPSSVLSTANSAASDGRTLSGDIERSLEDFRKGRKVEDLNGEIELIRVDETGGRSTPV